MERDIASTYLSFFDSITTRLRWNTLALFRRLLHVDQAFGLFLCWRGYGWCDTCDRFHHFLRLRWRFQLQDHHTQRRDGNVEAVRPLAPRFRLAGDTAVVSHIRAAVHTGVTVQYFFIVAVGGYAQPVVV